MSYCHDYIMEKQSQKTLQYHSSLNITNNKNSKSIKTLIKEQYTNKGHY